MLGPENLHEYQRFAIRYIKDIPNPGLFLDMGLGKTVSTITAVNELMFNEGYKVLVIAPRLVARDTWVNEVEEWSHLRHLRVLPIVGTTQQRVEKLRQPAEIYTISRDLLSWLVGLLGSAWDFDLVVVDESSSFKNPKSKRFKALRMVRPYIKKCIILTGTPSPNGLMDLWSQLWLLDRGERLGKTLTAFRDKYFNSRPGYGGNYTTYEPTSTAEEDITKRISDICVSMKSEDYLKLPERIDNYIKIPMTAKVHNDYFEFEKEQVLKLEGITLTKENAAALYDALSQFSNGAIYTAPDKKTFETIHDLKLERLDEIIDTTPGCILLFYKYRHDAARIIKRYASLKPELLKTSEQIKRWNENKIKLLVTHAASAGHGLNLQKGGDCIVWFGETNNLELFQQANKRLHRQGRLKPVVINHLLLDGSIDLKILAGRDNKEAAQDSVLAAVKALKAKYGVR